MSASVTQERWKRPVRHAVADAWARAAQAMVARLAEENGRLAPWLAVALGAGILVYFGLREEPPGWVVWLPLPPLAAALALAPRRPLLGWALGLVAAGTIGFAAAAWHGTHQPPALTLPTRAVMVAGIVQSVDPLPNGQRVTLAEARLSLEGEWGPPLPRALRLRLQSRDPARPVPGDRVEVRALVRPPSPPAFPGAWDFQRTAWFSGLGGSGFAIGPAEVTRVGGAAPPLAGLRTALESRVTEAIPGAAGAVAAALLTGRRSAIPEDDLVAMRDSGLAHLLSVSGLHIATVMALGFAVARTLLAAWPWLALRIDGKPAAAVVALAAGGFYLLLTGSQVPTLRSFLMAGVVTLAMLLGRRALSPRVLAAAAAAVLLMDPVQLLGPSFQMSFAAVLALIAGWEAARPRLLRWQGREEGASRWARRLALAVLGLALTSVLAGAATTPPGLHHFGRLQVYGVAANALAVPLTSLLIMPAGMAAVALMPFGLEGLALLPMGWGVEGVLWVARGVAGWPGSAWTVRPLPPEGLAAFAFGLCWLCLWRTGWRALGVPIMAVGLCAGLLVRPPDMLVSNDARMIALRTEEGAFLERPPPGAGSVSGFVRDVWLRNWGEAGMQTLPRDEAGFTAPGLACTTVSCRFRPEPDGPEAVLLRALPAEEDDEAPRGGRTWKPLMLDRAAQAEACRSAAVVVAAEPVRGGCRGALVVDRFSVWRDGPHAIWLDAADGPRVASDRAWRGDRPWVPPPPRPRSQRRASSEAELPLAPAETLDSDGVD